MGTGNVDSRLNGDGNPRMNFSFEENINIKTKLFRFLFNLNSWVQEMWIPGWMVTEIPGWISVLKKTSTSKQNYIPLYSILRKGTKEKKHKSELDSNKKL